MTPQIFNLAQIVRVDPAIVNGEAKSVPDPGGIDILPELTEVGLFFDSTVFYHQSTMEYRPQGLSLASPTAEAGSIPQIHTGYWASRLLVLELDKHPFYLLGKGGPYHLF